MDSILSTVLSIFSHNPIIILGIIAYVAFSIIRGKNTEESDEYDEYDNYGTSSSGQTWEDMEREYGISIERKIEELQRMACCMIIQSHLKIMLKSIQKMINLKQFQL